MTLVNRLTNLKARLNELPDRFGVPQYRNVVLRTLEQTYDSQNDLYFNTITDILTSPKPKVTNVNPKLVGMELTDNVFFSVNDFELIIVRNTDLLGMGSIDYVIIDPTVDGSGYVNGGIKCEIIYISDELITDWLVVARRTKDNHAIPQASNTITL